MLTLQPVTLLLLLFTTFISCNGVVSDPQTNLLNSGCFQYNRFDPMDANSFNQSLNAAFGDLRDQIANQSKHVAKAQQASGATPVFALFQCRSYLSVADCVACFTVAVAQIRNCSANAARVIYDGCFLRYESSNFFEQATGSFNSASCGNQTPEVATTTFNSIIRQVLMNLQTETPRITGFSAATKTPEVPDNNNINTTIYAYAQCTETISQSGCEGCLKQGYDTMQTCLPNSDGRAFDAGCFIRYSTTSFFPDNLTIINTTPLSKQGSRSNKAAIIGGVAGGGVALFLVLLSLFAWMQRVRRSEKIERVPRGEITGESKLKGSINYSYKELKSATKNFSEKNKLGEGGFGTVYKGTLKNGKTIAVKKLIMRQSNSMDEEFESEVRLITNVHHRNLVRLLGCCSKGNERILVYEYMKNNSLNRYLFGSNKGSLSWKQRYDIILGIARGLTYLHEEFHICIIHRDIKTNNILLDDDFQPKIADFGLARLLPQDQTHLSTRFAGTLGYTAPEYTIHGQLSEKADTYSYGIIVLEIISGQKNSELKIDDHADGEFLLQQAWKLYEKGMHLELVDNTLNPNEYDTEEVKKIIEISLLCTQASPAVRPTMSEVVVLLQSKGLSKNKIRPTMPFFVETDSGFKADTSSYTASSKSNATISTSTMISARS
ncbi:putative receptor-like protein kinase At4g00960 [Neltuma alba]|nr:putative receptor-like protein kinase At4g00960 [Prosopis alba]